MTEFERLNQQLLDYFSEIECIFPEQQKLLRLECSPGCYACCLSRDVTATLLEMLPFAISLFQQGKAEQLFEELSETSQDNCYFFRKESVAGERGHCTIYPYRPILCRVFGAFPRHDKWSNVELSVCKKIKQENPILFDGAVKNLQHSHFEKSAFAETWRLKIMNLRPDIGIEEYPINSAALQAITFASLYFRV